MSSTAHHLRIPTAFFLTSLLACGGRDPEGSGGDSNSGIVVTESGTEGTESSSSGASDSGEKFDLPDGESATMTGGDCNGGTGGNMGGDYSFTIIWVANTAEGTVSKIDTETAAELARYRTGPDTPDPSRTSVNLRGDVAIANRAGSVTKIAARIDDCVDANNDGMITTSTGPADILPWGSDECVLWNHDVVFPQGLSSNTGGPRAVAWDAGDPNENPCNRKPDLWVGWRDQPNTSVIIRKLNGSTGEVIGEVSVGNWQGNWDHGTYGGATDIDGAFWGLGTLGTLVKVDPETFTVQRWDNDAADNPYGIALDADGNPWLAGFDGALWRFDRVAEQFVNLGTTGPSARLRGLAIAGDGFAWIAANNPCALVQYDTTSDTVVNGAIALPGCDEPVGVSIDADGYVWVVDRGANRAYKVNPMDYTSQTVDGLVGPYTYSDMTGAGLDLVVNPPG